MVSYTFVQNDDGNLNVPYLYENDDKVILNWNYVDNNFNSNNPAARFATLFISPLIRGVLFYELSHPTPKHFSYLMQVSR